MISMYKEWGWMPKWELFGRETWTMEGDPAIPFIADTYLKGLRDFDINAAYEAFSRSANLRPMVIAGIAGAHLALPVEAETYLVELLAVAVDIGLGSLGLMLANVVQSV